jgi:hypothetical protein
MIFRQQIINDCFNATNSYSRISAFCNLIMLFPHPNRGNLEYCVRPGHLMPRRQLSGRSPSTARQIPVARVFLTGGVPGRHRSITAKVIGFAHSGEVLSLVCPRISTRREGHPEHSSAAADPLRYPVSATGPGVAFPNPVGAAEQRRDFEDKRTTLPSCIC